LIAIFNCAINLKVCVSVLSFLPNKKRASDIIESYEKCIVLKYYIPLSTQISVHLLRTPCNIIRKRIDGM